MLDFFGVLVKANELLNRVEELQLLAKRISRYEDPIKQFRALMHLKPSNWSKGCGWNQSKYSVVLLSLSSLYLYCSLLILIFLYSKLMMQDYFWEYTTMVLAIGKKSGWMRNLVS